MEPHKNTNELYRNALRAHCRPFHALADLDDLIKRLSGSRVVMLGEASHGTSEYYVWRARISQELIEKHGFDFVAVEGDWPPCHEVHRYLQGLSEAKSAHEALEHFKRWPTWMWANREVLHFIEHLKRLNSLRGRKVGFHGLDVYSLFESIDAVLVTLEKINPLLARRARVQYACFDRHGRDERRFARSLYLVPEGCRGEVLTVLKDLLATRLNEPTVGGDEVVFDAVQNARIAQNAERYYRAMVLGTEESWNVRDQHMNETLAILLDRYGPNSRGIVWEHNTHVGDYRATDMALHGQVNLGGLARERFGEDKVSLVGFSSYAGTVIASHTWDGPTEVMRLPPARPKSLEAELHEISKELGSSQLLLTFDRPFDQETQDRVLLQTKGHRAVGVIYDPAIESRGNYVPTVLPLRYDAMIFLDETRALHPLKVDFLEKELPETWPSGV